MPHPRERAPSSPGADELASLIAPADGTEGPAPWFSEWRERQEQILKSAEFIWAATPGSPEQTEASTKHQALVMDDQEKTQTALSASEQLPVFAAALERRSRATLGGGSVSSNLFVDETLGEVVERGTRAKSIRVLRGGHEEEITFERRDGLWYICLL